MIVRGWQAGSRSLEGCDLAFQLGAARGWPGSDPIGSRGIDRDAEGSHSDTPYALPDPEGLAPYSGELLTADLALVRF